MTDPGTTWATLQLVDFLSAVTDAPDETAAMHTGLERAVSALSADAGAIVTGETVVARAGTAGLGIPDNAFASFARAAEGQARLPRIGTIATRAVSFSVPHESRMVVVRAGEPLSERESTLLDGMARVLAMQLRMLRTVEGERALRVTSERQAHENARLLTTLQERQELLQRLTRIQRSISHRAPLQEVLDAVTTGARNLLGDDLAALRLIDPDDPGYVVMASHSGIREELVPKLRRGPANEGVGGRAVLERRLVIIDDYSHARDGIPAMKEDRLQAAMAAPVYENGKVAGGLLTASYRPGRRYSKEEQDALVAFADHASLALTDAKTVEAMRSAQRAKDMFLAMVSHELKTPLTVILGSLDTFRRHPGLDTRLRTEMTESAYARANELASLIDRLLKGARGELSSEREEVALPDLVARALRGFEHTAKVAVGPVPDVVCNVDPRLVSDVLGVFLENAVAHSPPGSDIYVDAGVDHDDVTLTVANDGSLPPDLDPEQLFRPFQRGADARSSGVGLGLYIAGRLARSAGGTIDVDSGGGRVSFTLRLPVDAGLERAPEPAAGE